MIEQPVKVTTPKVSVPEQPDSVAPAVPVPAAMAKFTVDVSEVTVLPPASSTVTIGWVPKATPPVEPLGCCVKTRCVGGPETVKVLLVAGSRLPSVAPREYVPGVPDPRLILHPAKVATPPATVCLFVLGLQTRLAPLPGCVATARVTVDVSAVTTLPSESSTVTVGWVAKVTPPAELLGDGFQSFCFRQLHQFAFGLHQIPPAI